MKSHSVLQYAAVLKLFLFACFLCPLPAISNVLMTFDNNMGAFFSEQTTLHVSVLSNRECGKEYYGIT